MLEKNGSGLPVPGVLLRGTSCCTKSGPDFFHAPVRIKIPASCGDAVLDALFAGMERDDRLYHSCSENSYIDRINKNTGHFVEVDDAMAMILKKACSFPPFSTALAT